MALQLGLPQSPNGRATEGWGGKSQPSSGEDRVTMQESSWQQVLSDPTKCWDDRRSKRTPNPDSRLKKAKDALGLHNRFKPDSLNPQLAIWDAGMRSPPGCLSSSIQGGSRSFQVDLEVELISKLCENGKVTEAVDALNLLAQRGCHIPYNLYYLVLKRCIAQKDLVLGRRIHALTVESGYEGHAFLATHLIGLYASHGRLEEAMRVFSKVTSPTAYNWASIIFAYARHGQPTRAIELYREMRQSPVVPDNHIFVAVLKACASIGDLEIGKDVHACIRASAVKPDIFAQTCLVDMYAKCGSLHDARRVFDRLTHKNVVTWTAMIGGYAQQGMGQEALRLYTSMQQEGITQPSCVTFVCLLQACASIGIAALPQGKDLHVQIERRGLQGDVVVGASLVSMYVKCGNVEDAQRVFDNLPQKNAVTWTAMIGGYAQRGLGQEALCLYNRMQQEGITKPSSFTLVSLLQACAAVGVAALHQGKQVHAQFEQLGVQADLVVGTSLVNMYAKCGSLEDAQKVFDTLPKKDVVTWTAMIAGYSQQGKGQQALSLYSAMQQEGITPPDSVTFVCLLQACAHGGVAALQQGKHLHVQIEEQGLPVDLVLGNSLVNMYAKCGSLEDARRVFDRLLQRDVVTWNAMVVGYSQQGMGQEALRLYSSMKQEGITPPDSVTFVGLLQACASVAALPLGKQLHVQLEERGLCADEVMGASLVNMYAKCGSLEDAQRVFDSLPERKIEAWGALIAGYAHQGDSETVFQLVCRMTEDGIVPDGMTLLSVLTVCSHMGLVREGRKYFEAMSQDYGVSPTIEHYTCMVDLLGRAGHIDEALVMVKTMPFQPGGKVWCTLLGACRKWKNVEVGLQAFEFAVQLDEKDAAPYVLMSNIYADSRMWEEAMEMQERRVKVGAWKQPGQTWWTDVDGVVHSFVVGDSKHSIYHNRDQERTLAAL